MARDRLAALVLSKPVTMHNDGRDKYGRTLGRIEIKGQDVSRTLVAEGLARHYVRFSKDAGLAAAERAARAAKGGLWAHPAPAPVPPWEWRASE